MATFSALSNCEFVETENCVLFEQCDVFVKSNYEDLNIQGSIQIIEKVDCSIWIKWQPCDEEKQNLHKLIIDFDIRELKSFKRASPKMGWSYMIFILKDGRTYPALNFCHGGTKTLKSTLEKYLHINKSLNDSALYLVKEFDPGALHKSFNELKLFDEPKHKETIVSRFVKDPYTTTFSGFSNVTRFINKNMLLPVHETSIKKNMLHLNDKSPSATMTDSSLSFKQLLHNQFVSGDAIDGTKLLTSEDSGFEVITKEIMPRLPGRSTTIRRGVSVSAEVWNRHLEPEGGRVTCVSQLLEAIFRGGLSDDLRREVWPYLLGVHAWDSTIGEKETARKQRVDDYFKIKLQWMSVSEKQEKRFSSLRERRSLIDKDVPRTDRTHEYFQGDGNPNLVVMRDILMTYGMYNFDLGYVQGMSDLLSPVLLVMKDEVESFWCFAHLMERMESNFDIDQAGMKVQLSQLQTLLQLLDAELCSYLDCHESSNMFFCFRWVLIHFKREFSFSNVMRLWEVLWTDHPCVNFHLLVCLAILDQQRSIILENRLGFTEILKHINDVAYNIDLNLTLELAEAMWLQLYHLYLEGALPDDVANVIGLHISIPMASSAFD